MTTRNGLVWVEIVVGAALPVLVVPITFTTMALAVAGTRDLYAPHHDPDAARVHGSRTIFLNTMWYQGLLGRYVSEWAGPDSFLRRLALEMRANCGPGDVLSVTGEVEGKRRDDGRALVDLLISIDTADRSGAVRAEATVELWLPTALDERTSA